MLRDPAREALADRDAQALERRVRGPEERPLEREWLAHPGLVIDAIDADRVVVRESLGLRHDRPRDRLLVAELAEPAGELGDRREPIGEGPARIGQPGAADRRGHLVAEGPGQRAFVGRPGVGLAVVEHEEAEGLVAEHERHEAHAPDTDGAVDRPELGGRGAHGAVEHADAAATDRVHASRRGVRWQRADRFDDLRREAPVGAERERRRGGLVVQPEAGPVDAEEPERLVDDVLEQPVDVASSADLGRDPAERVGRGQATGIGPSGARDVASGPVGAGLRDASFLSKDHGRRGASIWDPGTARPARGCGRS